MKHETQDCEISLQDRGVYLSAARDLLKTSRNIFQQYAGSGFNTERKNDRSFITEVDTTIENALRKELYHAFPEHGVKGEELEDHQPEADFQWIIDPIDGTEQYVLGIPTYGTIISLYYKNEPLVGLIDHPALKLTVSAASGLGIFSNDLKLPIYKELSTEDSTFDTKIVTAKRANFFRWDDDSAYFDAIMKKYPSSWIFDNCYAHTLVLCGSAAAMVEYNVRFHDISPLPVLLTERGGSYKTLFEKKRSEKITSYSAVFGISSVVDDLITMYESSLKVA